MLRCSSKPSGNAAHGMHEALNVGLPGVVANEPAIMTTFIVMVVINAWVGRKEG